MKLIVAIVNKDDSPAVSERLMAEGFRITRLATTGGFLRAGNTTMILGVDDAELDKALSIIQKNSRKRRAEVPLASPEFVSEVFMPKMTHIIVGGATVFVLNVEQFYKM